MMQIVRCKECGNADLPFGNVSVTVELSKSSNCDKCNRTDTQHQHFFFCSQTCFHYYMQKVMDGRASLKWEE